MDSPISTSSARRRILWQNVLTVVSAAILISAEVFGAAFAGSWAIANLFALGPLGARIARRAVRALRHRVMVQFVRRRAPRRAVHRRVTRLAAPRSSTAERDFYISLKPKRLRHPA